MDPYGRLFRSDDHKVAMDMIAAQCLVRERLSSAQREQEWNKPLKMTE